MICLTARVMVGFDCKTIKYISHSSCRILCCGFRSLSTQEDFFICEIVTGKSVGQSPTKRLPFAYPIYRNGYEKYFELQDKWVNSLERVMTFGRQGLFAHDNTHHALAMAYGVIDCLKGSGEFDAVLWQEYRAEFTKHVVEN